MTTDFRHPQQLSCAWGEKNINHFNNIKKNIKCFKHSQEAVNKRDKKGLLSINCIKTVNQIHQIKWRQSSLAPCGTKNDDSIFFVTFRTKKLPKSHKIKCEICITNKLMLTVCSLNVLPLTVNLKLFTLRFFARALLLFMLKNQELI